MGASGTFEPLADVILSDSGSTISANAGEFRGVFALYLEPAPAPPPPPSPPPSPPPTPPPTPPLSPPRPGAIAGQPPGGDGGGGGGGGIGIIVGAAGGAVALLAVGGFVYYRRWKAHTMQEVAPQRDS